MAHDKPLEVLREAADRKRELIDRCRQLLNQNPSEDDKAELNKRMERETARLFRLETCIDILEGKDYIFKDYDGHVNVVQPSEATSQLIEAAEERGARAIGFRIGYDRSIPRMEKEDKEAVLGMSVEDAIRIWKERGSPPIPSC